MSQKLPNILFFGIDSLRSDRMSLYGYERLTTPYMDEYLQSGVVFTKHYSPSIPTTSGYAAMLTGQDCFGTNVVALRHEGDLAPGIKTLAEVLGEAGYNTTCIGFGGNPSARGFQTYKEPSVSWGGWEHRPLRKAEALNDVALPELDRLAAEDKPFFLFMRHMDPHSPYLPPAPYDRMFYGGNEFKEENHSLDAMYDFGPFADYLASWIPPGCTDADYVDAQYDGEIAYMDACINVILKKLEAMGLEEETLVVFTSDHGETLNEHDCYYDHHGLYDCTLNVPLAFRMPGTLPEGMYIEDYSAHKDIVPTVLDIVGVDYADGQFYGRSLAPLIDGEERVQESEFYITEATWMRKNGWRTPQWKLIHALEPDFHFKPEVELYDLLNDPQENNNVAEQNPDVVAFLEARMQAHIAKREAEAGRTNPMYTNLNWHGRGCGAFTSSQQAYDSMHIGNAGEAKRLQASRSEKKE
ncbi:MAG: sulfatase family protein [Armatimonadota bacterium]